LHDGAIIGALSFGPGSVLLQSKGRYTEVTEPTQIPALDLDQGRGCHLESSQHHAAVLAESPKEAIAKMIVKAV
jgi:hypothetical protein